MNKSSVRSAKARERRPHQRPWMLRGVLLAATRRYLIAIGLLANLLLLALVGYWAVNKVGDVEAFRTARRGLLGPYDGIPLADVKPVAPGTVNSRLSGLPANRWVKLHTQSPGEAGSFSRQAHAGAVFDTRRGRLVVFGSDTHGDNWDNSLRYFDMASLSWAQAYAPADPASYRISDQGYPVTGYDGEQPWAMHTFDGLAYDPFADRLIVASHPGHLDPARFGNISRALWAAIRHHPTWVYDFSTSRWQVLVVEGESFFPYATAWDSGMGQLIGVKPDGYWRLDALGQRWERLHRGDTPYAWHNAAAFDSKRSIVVSFGTHQNENHVWQYSVADDRGQKMPTPGERPPGDQSVPLVYHPEADRVVALVDA